jgi:DNA-binding transcriptional MocR family regulator
MLTPDVAAEQMLRNSLQATAQMASPFMVALVMNWLGSGVADQIVAAIRNEAIGRQQLAAKILKGHSFAASARGHHLWLSLPRHWDRADYIAHVLRDGLAVVGSEAFAVDRAGPHAVRVSLGAARNRAELGTALHLLVGALKTSNSATQVV